MAKPVLAASHLVSEGLDEMLSEGGDPVVHVDQIPGFRHAYSLELADLPDSCEACVCSVADFEGGQFCEHPAYARPYVPRSGLCGRFLRRRHWYDRIGRGGIAENSRVWRYDEQNGQYTPEQLPADQVRPVELLPDGQPA